VQNFGKPLQTSIRGLTHLFPVPKDLVHADLSRAGIRGDRAATLSALACAICNGKITFAASMTLEEATSQMCNVLGIGASTAHYIAMRALGEPDAFPFADPGLARALKRDGNFASAPEVIHIADSWRPWRAYAAMHLCTAVTARDDKTTFKRN
jgi:AraC family transcriptional regulator, regulatory protein of adaptative response / DNA-3-methyladenine glycosylase II